MKFKLDPAGSTLRLRGDEAVYDVVSDLMHNAVAMC